LQSTLLCLSARVVSEAATAGAMIPDILLNENRRPSHRGHGQPVYPPRHRTRSTGNLLPTARQFSTLPTALWSSSVAIRLPQMAVLVCRTGCARQRMLPGTTRRGVL